MKKEGVHMASASSRWFGLLARIGGRAGAAGLLVTLCLVMFAAPAGACDVLDVACVEDTAGSVTETVEDTVEDAAETVDETVEETTETVDEIVENVTGETEETVEGTVSPVIGQTDGVIGGPTQPTVPGVDLDPVPPRTVDDPAPPGSGGTGNGSDGDGSGVGDGPAGTPSGGVVGPFALDPPALGGAPAIENTLEPRGFLGGFAGAAGAIASLIAFPLALALLVFLFVAFQDRLDGRDPKLALAATSPDVLRFG